MARMRRGERALHFRHSFRVRRWSRFNYLCLSFRLRHDHASLRLPRLSQSSSCQWQRTTDPSSHHPASIPLGTLCTSSTSTGTGKRKVSKVAGQSLDCYCVCSELLSASIADALLFVNILVSGIFHGHFAQRLAVNKPCLQIIRCLLWKQTTTHSIRNNNPMFDRQPPTQFFWATKYCS